MVAQFRPSVSDAVKLEEDEMGEEDEEGEKEEEDED